MRDSSIKWLYAVPGRRKLYILALTAVQAVYGASGVLYALLLRNIVDAAAGHDSALFRREIILIIFLVAAQLGLRAAIRYLTELSRSTFENIFKRRLTEMIMRKDFQRVNAVHSGEWMNRLTNDAAVVANGYVDIIPGLSEWWSSSSAPWR